MKSKAELSTCIFICNLINVQLDAALFLLKLNILLQNTQFCFILFSF